MTRAFTQLAAIILAVMGLTTAALAADFPPTPAEVSVVMDGKAYIFQTEDARPMYVFDKDAAGKSTCYDDCAKTMRPVTAPATAKPLGDWTVLTRTNGVRQWVYKGKPIYIAVKGKTAPSDSAWHIVTP